MPKNVTHKSGNKQHLTFQQEFTIFDKNSTWTPKKIFLLLKKSKRKSNKVDDSFDDNLHLNVFSSNLHNKLNKGKKEEKWEEGEIVFGEKCKIYESFIKNNALKY